jgi:hypothetical protein
MLVDEIQKDVLDAVAKSPSSVFVRAATAQAATEEVIAWAEERGLKVVDVSPYYGTDLRGQPFVGGTPPVSGVACPPWVAALLDGDGPRLLLLADVVAASRWMPSTNTSVLRSLVKDRDLSSGRLPDDCLVVATAAAGEGGLPGLSSDTHMHLTLS